MKIASESKLKVKYALTIATELIKLTSQILICLPGAYFAYMGFKGMGWSNSTVTITSFYECAAYLLFLLGLQILVTIVGFVAMTVIALTIKEEE